MKKTTKATILLLTSMLFLTGCAQKGEIITIDNNQYVRSGDSYTRIGESKKTFNPGDHYVYYNDFVEYHTFSGVEARFESESSGWGNINFDIPPTPDGYRYVNSVPIDTYGHGETRNVVHVFVNEEPVECVAIYNEDSKAIGYFEPGYPVKKLVLEE